ncbi:hypothetical protein AcW1_004033 [Taiwanofungus camphoratus]|nr:hypothetical protein AcW1_004033 [Antrodia cinnamomea]
MSEAEMKEALEKLSNLTSSKSVFLTQNFTVERMFICQRFGRGARDTFPEPKAEKLDKHGYNNLMCINLEYASYAPQKPGHPGLVFATTPTVDPWSMRRPKTMVLFVRLQKSRWLYLGSYELAASFTTDEWRAQTDIVRKNWSDNIRAGVNTSEPAFISDFSLDVGPPKKKSTTRSQISMTTSKSQLSKFWLHTTMVKR